MKRKSEIFEGEKEFPQDRVESVLLYLYFQVLAFWGVQIMIHAVGITLQVGSTAVPTSVEDGDRDCSHELVSTFKSGRRTLIEPQVSKIARVSKD
jgi:hypothetical protein